MTLSIILTFLFLESISIITGNACGTTMTTGNVEIGTKEIGAVANEDDNPNEILGFFTFSTTGEVFVDREWLLDQWEEYNLPTSILPTETTNWQAYRRAVRWIQEQSEHVKYEVWNDHYEQNFDCELEISKSNEHGSNVFLVYARTFLPEEICGKDGGDWTENRVGKMDFYRPEDTDFPGAMTTEIEVDEDNAHYEHLKSVFQQAREKEKQMRKTHNFNDLQSALEGYRDTIANAVEIRRSVYFIPAHHQETLEGLMNVWQGLNQFKEGGEAVRIDRTPVVDMAEQRELVASKVEEKLQSMVDSIVSEIITEFQEDAEKTADAAANEIMEELGDSEGMAGSYNKLLGMKLSIKEILEERREEMKEESEQVIQNVLDQETFEDME